MIVSHLMKVLPGIIVCNDVVRTQKMKLIISTL